MTSQQLLRIDERRFVLVDHELALLLDGAQCAAKPILLGFSFRTASSGWRIVRASGADLGFAPTANLATVRLVEDADATPHPYGEPLGEDALRQLGQARRTIMAGGDLPHRTACELLALAVDTIDVLIGRHELPEVVKRGLPL